MRENTDQKNSEYGHLSRSANGATFASKKERSSRYKKTLHSPRIHA